MSFDFFLLFLICVIVFLFIWKMRKRYIRKKELILQKKKDEKVHKFEEVYRKMAEERKRLYILNGGVDIENKTVFDFTNDPKLLRKLIDHFFAPPFSSKNPYHTASKMSIDEFYNWNKEGRWGQLNALRDFAAITGNEKLMDAIEFEHQLFVEYCVEMMNRFGIIVN